MIKIIKSKLIVVFLKNKLISIDSILPLALEINKCCGYRFYFIIWQYESYRSVIEDNIVMRDMAQSIGKIVCPSDPNRSIISNKIKKISIIINVLSKLFFKRSYVIHFDALDYFPLLLLAKLIKKNRIARCESAITGRYVDNLQNNERIFNRGVLQERSPKGFLSRYEISKYPDNNSGILIGFDSEWNWFKHPDATFCKKLVFDEGKNANRYTRFISKNIDHYLSQENLISLDKNNTIILILGHYGNNETDNNYRNKLLYEALIVLRRLELNVIIKPHIFCDMHLVKSIIKDSKCKGSNIYFTKIHPQVLQKVAFTSIFVNNSSIRCEYKFTGFPVIQYNGGMYDRVFKDRCSDIICSNQHQLKNSLMSLSKDNGNDNKLKKKQENGSSCLKIGKVINCERDAR